MYPCSIRVLGCRFFELHIRRHLSTSSYISRSFLSQSAPLAKRVSAFEIVCDIERLRELGAALLQSYLERLKWNHECGEAKKTARRGSITSARRVYKYEWMNSGDRHRLNSSMQVAAVLALLAVCAFASEVIFRLPHYSTLASKYLCNYGDALEILRMYIFQTHEKRQFVYGGYGYPAVGYTGLGVASYGYPAAAVAYGYPAAYHVIGKRSIDEVQVFERLAIEILR